MSLKVSSEKIGIIKVFRVKTLKSSKKQKSRQASTCSPVGYCVFGKTFWCLKSTVTCEMMVFILSLVTEMSWFCKKNDPGPFPFWPDSGLIWKRQLIGPKMDALSNSFPVRPSQEFNSRARILIPRVHYSDLRNNCRGTQYVSQLNLKSLQKITIHWLASKLLSNWTDLLA